MFVRRMVVIIIALAVLAAGFQFLRSFGVINLIENVNAEFELAEPVFPAIPEKGNFEKYLVIYNSDDKNSRNTAQQIFKVFKYIGKDYEKVNIDQDIEDIFQYDCIFFAFERLDYLIDIDSYMEYVRNGRRIVFLVRPVNDNNFKKISKYIGIKEYKTDLVEKTGIEVLTDFMLGVNGFVTDSEKFANSCMQLVLDKDCTVHMKTTDDTPLLWTKDYGKGKFIVLNGTMLNDRGDRGVIVSIMGLARQDFIYPVMNIKMLHIDDFPAPIPEGYDEQIYEDYNRDIRKFYREVWWSDMVRISKKYNLQYSGFVIEKYNGDTMSPFERASSTDIKNLIFYGRELLGMGGEIGIHGYNHQSLAMEGYIKQDLGYNPWITVTAMEESIKELLRFIHTVFGRYDVRAYVPPSNILSPQGRAAVIAASPNLRIIASQYYQNEFGDIYAQEFEIADDGIIEFPRITYGYTRDDELLWSLYNGVNMYGIFSHFIHPDDILDKERSKGKSWSELSGGLEQILDEVNTKYGWLSSYTVSPAAQQLVKYLECRPVIDYQEDNGKVSIDIYSENFRPDIYCILRTDKEISACDDCEYEKVGSNAYLIILKDDICSLNLE